MNFQEKLKEIRELAGLDENVKSILKQMTGKELVSYEGIDALVAALMTFYNGELKKKATTNHTHSKEQIEEFPVFGTGANEMLEGVKLAETLGIPYGGILNNSNTKTEGTAYYDSTTKKTYKCTVTNTLNYADASKYEAISNNDLLLKFQNYIIESGNNSSGYYQKFSNGFIVQWGTSNAGYNNTVSFPKAFKDTNYNIQISLIFNNDTSDGWATHYIKDITKTSFRYNSADSTGKIKWFACGY